MSNTAGNCFQACVASILDLRLEDIPDVPMVDGWLEQLNHDLADRGFRFWLLMIKEPEGLENVWKPPGYAILTGKSPRGDWNHAVICLDGEMVHDPHPDGTGVREPHVDWVFVVPHNPGGTVLPEPRREAAGAIGGSCG